MKRSEHRLRNNRHMASRAVLNISWDLDVCPSPGSVMPRSSRIREPSSSSPRLHLQPLNISDSRWTKGPPCTPDATFIHHNTRLVSRCIVLHGYFGTGMIIQGAVYHAIILTTLRLSRCGGTSLPSTVPFLNSFASGLKIYSFLLGPSARRTGDMHMNICVQNVGSTTMTTTAGGTKDKRRQQQYSTLS